MNKKLNQVVKTLIVIGMLIGVALMAYLAIEVASGDTFALYATEVGQWLVVVFFVSP